MEKALAIAEPMIKSEVKDYFGHVQADVAITPRMIIMNAKFEKLAAVQITAQSPLPERTAHTKLMLEMEAFAKETETEIIRV